MRRLLPLLVLLLCAAPAAADHPSAYEEDRSRPGEVLYLFHPALCELRVRSVPADPPPGGAVALDVEVRPLDPGSRFEGDVHVTVVRDETWGEDPVVWGPETARARGDRARLRPEFGDEGPYRVSVELLYDGQPLAVEYHALAGGAQVPWGRLLFGAVVVGGFAVLSRRRLFRLRSPGAPAP